MPPRPCLLLTRPRADSSRFAEAARRAGWDHEVLIAPLMQIVLHPPAPAQLARARTLVFTSQHAVAAVADVAPREAVVWAVGPHTAQAARAAGFADVHVAQGDATSLLQALAAAPPPEPVLHLRGKHAATDIAEALRASGHAASSLIVYAQAARALEPAAATRLEDGGDVVLTAFSPRSAALLAEALAPLSLHAARLHLVAISAAAAAPLDELTGARCRIASHPDVPAMLDALIATQAALEPWEKPR